MREADARPVMQSRTQDENKDDAGKPKDQSPNLGKSSHAENKDEKNSEA